MLLRWPADPAVRRIGQVALAQAALRHRGDDRMADALIRASSDLFDDAGSEGTVAGLTWALHAVAEVIEQYTPYKTADVLSVLATLADDSVVD